MAERTITFAVEPGDEAFVVWNNLIQKGIVLEINSKLTKPSLVVVEKTEIKVTIAGPTVVKKDVEEVFTSADDAAAWLELNVNPPAPTT